MQSTSTYPTVGELAADRPMAVRALQRHGIDYCCNQQSLEAACAEHGLTVKDLLDEVRRDEIEDSVPPKWEERPLPELIDYIVELYHKPLDTDLPRLDMLARKVLAAHALGHRDQLAAVLHTFEGLREAIEHHMDHEEHALFPWIRSGQKPSLEMPIHGMELEHESASWMLKKLRELTDNYKLPADASESWRALWHGLESMEARLLEHQRIEDEILFPRVLAEQRAKASGKAGA
jgi:regulator of cell morphogenesis and NO signaling